MTQPEHVHGPEQVAGIPVGIMLGLLNIEAPDGICWFRRQHPPGAALHEVGGSNTYDALSSGVLTVLPLARFAAQ
jgi:hypothetical protein